MFPLPLLRSTFRLVLGLSLATTACGGDPPESGAQSAGDAGDPGAVARVAVDPCTLLTNQEISEQLFLAVSPSERPSWTTPEFDVTGTEVEWGVARRCEYKFQSRAAVGGGPIWHSDFNVMVIRSDAILVPESDRLPVEGAGPDIFKSRGEERVYYVTKGGHAAILTAFPGTHEVGEAAGRVALLRRIAERLP